MRQHRGGQWDDHAEHGDRRGFHGREDRGEVGDGEHREEGVVDAAEVFGDRLERSLPLQYTDVHHDGAGQQDD
ncbi:hypothetical protein OG758_41520 [Streptomyces sp. NBC_01474]|nr:hypothetical protein [Streptomyces sp. NBC_01474]WSE00098.1 hypothetical protein OG758_41520 [Streptomyces sp. NBC_01474]